MNESVSDLYTQGLERYKAGATAEELLPVFKEICDRAPKSSAALTSLSWLYLLVDKPKSALKTAQKSIKIDHNDPQGRVNLALAMLGTGEKGVRKHIEVAQQLMSIDPEVQKELQDNIEDGLKRKPDWKELQRVKNWLLE